MKRLVYLRLGEVILNINTTLLIFYVIIIGTVTKRSNGNDILCHYYRYRN